MLITKITDSVVKQICALNHQGKGVGEIAQLLNLKKMQVSTILAHERSKTSISTDTASNPEEVASNAVATIVQSEKTNGAEEQEDDTTEVESEEIVSTGIYIGDDEEYGDPLYWNPTDTQSVQNPHLMIMGESGSGKTYAAQCLIAELAQRNTSSVIFDYGQSFELDNFRESF